MKFLSVVILFVASVNCDEGIPMLELLPASSACQVNVNGGLGNPQPLYIRPGTELFFHPTDSRGIIEMSANEQMEVFCTTGFASPAVISSNLIRISCVSGTTFQHNGISYNFNQFTCREFPIPVAIRRMTIARCFNQSTIVDVGFHVENRFLKVHSVCHNPRSEVNYYAEYQLTPASNAQERNVIRPRWSQGDFYPGKNIDNLYTRIQQRNTISTILNSVPRGFKFIEEPESDVFLARGHMAAMTDFIFANEQRATFFFINVAPQFQTFNSLNWVSVEISSRRLASNRGITMDVYTGTFGITTLPDDHSVNHEIFIDFRNRQVPVPMLYYKILVNRADQSGVVLLGVNNYHLTLQEIQRDYIICNDVSDRIDYVSWSRTNLARGYGYACEVNDFLRRVPHVQGLVVRSLLV